MKTFLVPTTKKISEATKVILIINFLSGCAGIPAGKVKLDDYPEIKSASNVNLSYAYEWPYPYPYKQDDKENLEFNQKIGGNFKSKNLSISEAQKNDSSGCQVNIAARVRGGNFFTCPVVTNLIAMLTVTIIPYYCQHTYEARATLISHPQDSEISGTILPSISGAKPGDIFLDSDDQPAKILKTYELEDKVHEVWSLLWMLSWLVVEPNKYSSIQNKYLDVGRHPDVAKIDTENTLSEALTRSILHDASTFKECQKPSSSPSNKK